MEEDEEDDIGDDEEEHEDDMIDGEDTMINADQNHEAIDDDDCDGAGPEGGDHQDESELEKYLKDVSQGKYA
jgi:hypothetical protein